MPTTRIIVADDHQILRQGLVAVLGVQPDMTVVGQASDGREAVALAREQEPDIVVMDVAMPNFNGIDAARQILANCPSTKVVILSAYGHRRMIAESLRAGASGYVLKDAAMEELLEAIRTVMAGDRYLGPQVAAVLASEYLDAEPRHNGGSVLTPREREVLQLIAEGKATKEAAAALGVSVKTVETHRRSLMEKLALFSVAELTKYAIREGLTTVEP
jgi:DNA-binding NarL/FixJ family response regulator